MLTDKAAIKPHHEVNNDFARQTETRCVDSFATCLGGSKPMIYATYVYIDSASVT